MNEKKSLGHFDQPSPNTDELPWCVPTAGPLSVQNIFHTNLKEKTRDLCRKKYYKRKKMNLIGIGTRDLRHVRPACYHYATVTFT